MIVLPAIPAIVAALTPIVQAAAVSAAIGGLFGAGAGAVGCGIDGAREHGEINHDVVTQSAHCAAEEAAKGALLGGAFGPVIGVMAPAAAPVIGRVIAPAAPVIQVIDDAVQPVIGVVDDVARSTVGSIDDAATVAGSAAIVDDTASSLLSRARRKLSAATNGIGSGIRLARNKLYARFYSRMGDAPATGNYVYVMEDAATGLHKIGTTTKQPKIRLDQISNDVKNKVDYVCIIKTDNSSGLERVLHHMFSSQRTTHPIPHSGETEWFTLSAAQIAAACSY